MQFKLENFFFFTVALIVVLLDQISKFFVLKNSLILMNNVEIFENLNFVFVLNKGISFGFLSSLNISFYLGIISMVISVFIIIWIIRTSSRIEKISLSFILGGAIGNGFDRINKEYVLDFIDFHAFGFHWPAFNLADSFITVGAIIFIFRSVKLNLKQKS